MKINNEIIHDVYHELLQLKTNSVLSLSNHPHLVFALNSILALNASTLPISYNFEMFDALDVVHAVAINLDNANPEIYNCLANTALNKKNLPIVLDPGGVSEIKYRLDFVNNFLNRNKVFAIRGTFDEIISLVAHSNTAPKNLLKSKYDPQIVFASAQNLSKKYDCVVVINGPLNLVVDYGNYYFFDSQDNEICSQIDYNVTGFGVSLTHLLALFMCLGKNPLRYHRFVLATSALLL